MDSDDEPVFKKSKWGTNRYVYNHRNPVGLALIIISLVFGAVMMLMIENEAGPFAPEPSPSWNPDDPGPGYGYGPGVPDETSGPAAP